MISKTKAALLASALLVMPGAALAQNEVSQQANALAGQAEELQMEANLLSNVVADDAQLTADAADMDGDGVADGDRDDDDGDSGRWGLLGLLGLAGLLGLKRRDDDHAHVDRDHRTTSAGTTTTRPGTRTGTDTDPRL
jgi:MYXO-CTERM domain-containing protein